VAERVPARHGLEPLLGTLPRAAGGTALVLTVMHDRAYVNLRGDANDAGFCVAVQNALDQPLPRTANTFTRGCGRIYWLGPDEWLIATPAQAAQTVLGRLQRALAGRPGCATDISGGLVGLGLTGAEAAATLARGCTVDLHSRVFTDGRCVRCALARANVLLACAAEPAGQGAAPLPGAARQTGRAFEIIVRRSFAEYVVLWLNRAGEEAGIGIRDASIGVAEAGN